MQTQTRERIIEREVVITRVIDSPRELVWKAWTEPEKFARWYGLSNSTLSDVRMDVREGGGWSALMRIPGARDISWKADYLEVREPERLVFALRDPDNHSSPNVEKVTVTFEDLGTRTRLSFRQTGTLPAEQYEGALRQGWNSFFDRLDKLVAIKMDSVVHFELPYLDADRVSKFYAQAFGWRMRKFGEEMGNYVTATTTETDENRMVKSPGAINGGFFPKKPDSPAQYPSVVIAVEDIREAIKKVSEAGGEVLGEPMEIPGIGQYVSFTDTEGNRVAMLQPRERMAPQGGGGTVGERRVEKRTKLNAYLNFSGNAEEAFKFYRSVFGGEFGNVTRFKDLPMQGVTLRKEDENKLMHISLPIGKDDVLMASDVLESRGHELAVGNNVSISIFPESKEEADRIFKGVSAGGTIEMPLGDQPWGDYYGGLIDKFGIHWMIDYTYPNAA